MAVGVCVYVWLLWAVCAVLAARSLAQKFDGRSQCLHCTGVGTAC